MPQQFLVAMIITNEERIEILDTLRASEQAYKDMAAEARLVNDEDTAQSYETLAGRLVLAVSAYHNARPVELLRRQYDEAVWAATVSVFAG